jgi:hypothetical protein
MRRARCSGCGTPTRRHADACAWSCSLFGYHGPSRVIEARRHGHRAAMFGGGMPAPRSRARRRGARTQLYEAAP